MEHCNGVLLLILMVVLQGLNLVIHLGNRRYLRLHLRPFNEEARKLLRSVFK